MKIIRGGVGDIDKFYELFEKSLRDEYFYYKKENARYFLKDVRKSVLRKEISKKEKTSYLAYDNKRLVGYLLVWEDFAGVAFGNWLAVHKDHRKKGVGSELLKKWEEDVKKETPAHSIYVFTTENDLGFYKKNGFIVAGKFEEAWMGIDHYLLYKTIRKPNPKKYM